MTQTKETKVLLNHLGEAVPVKYVPKLDLHKNKVAITALKKAQALSDELIDFKLNLMAVCDDIYEQMKEDAEVRTGKKGNYTITSFDKQVKIEISIQERIEFGDQIKLAQEKLNEFLKEKTQGADHELSVLVNSAFQTNKGRLDTKRILGLFSLQINHATWKKAMELLKQSISRDVSKRYMRIGYKEPEGEYKFVKLDFSSI